ncbi:MAG: CDF family Co(II)/Ni(II) efflux transporter DmeF [Oligoflexus sp.]
MLENADHIAKHDFLSRNTRLPSSEKRTLYVIILTVVTMLVEIIAGYFTGSMALLADGWHMFSHAGALLITFLTYRLAQSPKLKKKFSFGTGKFLPLGGYTSAILLAVVALLMFIESGHRLIAPEAILFKEAMIVAVLGLVVNLASAWILGGHQHHGHDHHDHHHHDDHNLKAAYFHVLADALTSLLAIIGLAIAYYYQFSWIDPAIGILGSFIILKWSFGLCKTTAWELLDGHPAEISVDRVIHLFDEQDAKVIDLHFWNIAPGTISASLIIQSQTARGTAFYRNILLNEYKIDHLVIEERVARSAKDHSTSSRTH